MIEKDNELTVKQAKQKLLDNIINGKDELPSAQAYKCLVEAEFTEKEISERK